MTGRTLAVAACLATACASASTSASRSLPVARQTAFPAVSPTRSSAPPAAPHLVVIVEENRSPDAVLGSSSAPYVNQLAQTYGVADASYGQSHPSLPNYLELISGSTQGVTDDGTGYRFSGTTLPDQLASAGIGWRAYMEDLPSPCFDGSEAGGYAKKHDPFMYFASITQAPAQCDRVVPFTQLAADRSGGALPPFVWITPNLCDDGHDCDNASMDGWLRSHLAPLLSSAWFAEDGVAIITWDEGEDDSGCGSGAHGGRILTIVISSRVHGHLASAAAVDHAGVLRSIEQLYSLPLLGDAACVCSGSLNALIG